MRRFYYLKKHERKMFIPCWNAVRVGNNTAVKLWRVIACIMVSKQKNKSVLDTIEVVFYSNRGPPTKESHNVSKSN